MKLSTLLLSSAALVVAGSAYAADLPAKKGAPAAKPAATGCPAFGAGFFQIPGGDTCISFSGFARYEGKFVSSTSAMTQVGKGRLVADVRSNSDVGVVRGVVRVNVAATAGTASSDRAYVALGGFTAGAYGSSADIAPSATNNIDYQLGYDPSATGMKYSMPLGSTTVTVAAEEATNTNSYTAKNPDLLLKVSTSIAGASVDLVGASHQNSAGQGYAFLAAGKFAGGPATFGIWGGTSQGAVTYTGAQSTTNATYDVVSGSMTTGTAFGGSVAFAAGNGTLGLDAVQSNVSVSGTTYSTTAYGVQYALAVAKGLTVTPEFQYSSVEGTASNTTYLRIQRDF